MRASLGVSITCVVAACAAPAATVRTFEPADRAAVTAVLDAQVAAWNRGDLAAYMAGYARTDDLVFTSGGKVRKGWQPTFDHYQAKYATDPAAMGTLAFEILQVDPLGADGAVVLGHWILTNSPSDGRGVFSVVLARRPEGWRIVHDHTSLAPAESATAAPPAAAIDPWPVPTGYKSEVIPFPLDFAPSLAHRGVEELRFAPGMFDPKAPGYWSYVFTWRTEDPADLDAAGLASELATYFRGLAAAVDKDLDRAALATITVRATAEGPRFVLAAQVIDAFKTKQRVVLAGWAERTSCGTGALWVFVLAPIQSPVRADLDALARQARCGQPAR